ncbi:hydrogenase 4 membrane subunit [Thermofilum pendens]|uniref:NADH-ubiquinone oxidoreductase, chain 4L n=1 Tax=Thermofilum pendens (strain DSM 2475 / Hrk 5) TaxID=368408 RepID=A1RWL6_THEPD|nr:hydrogenase 4 membrane subunit [Thermofilum pendens]ABL77596.1 NADH-ubiquinone oxidoreductase, chain 4L [Thermofilum pendens Hrk 5]
MLGLEKSIGACAALMVLTASYINEERNLRRATYAYCVQTLLLASIFFMLSTVEWYFALWGLTAILTKAVLVPYFILRTTKRVDAVVEEEPYLGGWASHILLGALIAIGFAIGTRIVSGWESVPLSVSVALFLIGLHLMVTRRDALKQILGICHFENGSHLTLAVMAPGLPETVEVGVLTDAVLLVLVCCLLAEEMKKVVGTLDTGRLSLLRY